jgi:hypothetical protein
MAYSHTVPIHVAGTRDVQSLTEFALRLREIETMQVTYTVDKASLRV